MIELQWTVPPGATHEKPKLQMRLPVVGFAGIAQPGEWIDVPTVVSQRQPGDRPTCCAGGPQWGHAWDCKTLP